MPAGRADSGVFNIHLNVVGTCGLLDGIHIVALCSVAIRQFTDEEEWLQIRDKMQEFLGTNEDLRDSSLAPSVRPYNPDCLSAAHNPAD